MYNRRQLIKPATTPFCDGLLVDVFNRCLMVACETSVMIALPDNIDHAFILHRKVRHHSYFLSSLHSPTLPFPPVLHDRRYSITSQHLNASLSFACCPLQTPKQWSDRALKKCCTRWIELDYLRHPFICPSPSRVAAMKFSHPATVWQVWQFLALVNFYHLFHLLMPGNSISPLHTLCQLLSLNKELIGPYLHWNWCWLFCKCTNQFLDFCAYLTATSSSLNARMLTVAWWSLVLCDISLGNPWSPTAQTINLWRAHPIGPPRH